MNQVFSLIYEMGNFKRICSHLLLMNQNSKVYDVMKLSDKVRECQEEIRQLLLTRLTVSLKQNRLGQYQ